METRCHRAHYDAIVMYRGNSCHRLQDIDITSVVSFTDSDSQHQHWMLDMHADVIKWKYFSRNWPLARGIHRSPMNSPHKGQWCGALVFSLIYAWINGWVNNREAGHLKRHRCHYDITVMGWRISSKTIGAMTCYWNTPLLVNSPWNVEL